jgi:hypothetical protein
MVSSGVARRITLRFHDPPAQPAFRQIMYNDHAYQKPREF